MTARRTNIIKTRIILVAMSVFLFGCGSPPVENKSVVPPSEPLTTSPVTVDKPVNVSFSTYSKEWPVDWQRIDPDEKYAPTPHDVKQGVLRIDVPSQKDLYGENRTAPRYVKAIKGDFQIETRVTFSPKENYQGAGLIVYKDDNNYIRFERAYGGVGGGGEGIRLDVRTANEYKPIGTPDAIQTDAGEVDLKIIRIGRIFTAFWRLDEESEWREAGEFESDYPETILAGIVACNTARPITAEFNYIRLAPVPKN